jgi:hypothetical protein
METFNNSRGCRVRLGLTLACVALIATGCDHSVADELRPGRYTYTAVHSAPGGTDPVRLAGVLEITRASADTIIGHWDVPQLYPELRVLENEDGSIDLYANPTYFGTLVHHVTGRGGLQCGGTYAWVVQDGAEKSVPVRCEIAPEPATP